MYSNPIQQKRTNYESCPCCGQRNALSVTIDKGRTLAHCHYGCPQDAVWKALRGGGTPTPPIQQEPPQRHAKESVRALALKLWGKSLPAAGTLVDTYLASRGIVTPPPKAIRFIPNCLHRPSGAGYPVMIAAATDWQGRLQAIHRTYLAHDGNGKAPVTPAKMTLGQVGGLSCHLAPSGEELAISEGIETGLSVLQATGIPTWAALSAGGIRNLILPPLPLASMVTIAADNDPVGIRSAQAAAHQWREEGRKVKIATPPQGKDFNDILIEAAR